jgi:pimeloyl-ACP methyl ester carboxylesterase
MYLQVGGQNTYAATGGKDFDAKLPTVMFVPGTGLDHRCWALQTRWFAYNGFSVLAPDFPGHSLSEGEPLTSIEAMGDWLADFILASGAEKVHAIGHSQGFLDLLELARQHPETLLSLTGVGTAGEIPVNPALIEAAEKDPGQAADLLLQWGFGTNAQFGVSAVPGMQPIAIGRQIMSSNPILEDLIACSHYKNGNQVAETINLPTKLILARKDRLTPVKAGIAIGEKMNAKISIIEKYGHMLPMEAPKILLNELRKLTESS